MLPYAALAGAGFVGYMWLDKKGYLNGIKDGIKGTVDTISEVPSKLVDTIKNRTGADNFANGDWIGGAQQIVRNIPIVNLGEKGFNAAKDWIEDKLPDNPIPEIGSGGPVEFPKIDIPEVIDTIPEVIPEVTPQVIPEIIPVIVEDTKTVVQEVVPESVWTDTPLKYVPGVAIRNGLVKLFGR